MNKLTIIISFLNEGEEVERTVSGIRSTVRDTVDIILINDASDDGYHYEEVALKIGMEGNGDDLRGALYEQGNFPRRPVNSSPRLLIPYPNGLHSLSPLMSFLLNMLNAFAVTLWE
ncbi:MAG: glycosyltransferase [Mediterranea sp.]|jgi:hypothetical protein|nr:glycosyltransferase [Mediterranea sp.]